VGRTCVSFTGPGLPYKGWPATRSSGVPAAESDRRRPIPDHRACRVARGDPPGEVFFCDPLDEMQLKKVLQWPMVYTSEEEKVSAEWPGSASGDGGPLIGSGASTDLALRSRAEESLRRQSSLSVARSEAVLPESAQRTLHELRVTQVELEMQNEELRSAQVALEAARARNVELYDLAPVGYCTVGRQNLILEANLSAATLLGIDRTTLIGQPLSRYIKGDDADHFHLQRRRILDTGESLAGELRMLTATGTPFWAQFWREPPRPQTVRRRCMSS